MKHAYTIYYIVGGRGVDKAEMEMFKKGLDACKTYECDYRQFDPVFGVLICRKKGEDGKFCEELSLPVSFYVGEIMHAQVQERHELHMKKEKQVQDVMTEIAKNGNAPGPESQ